MSTQVECPYGDKWVFPQVRHRQYVLNRSRHGQMDKNSAQQALIGIARKSES